MKPPLSQRVLSDQIADFSGGFNVLKFHLVSARIVRVLDADYNCTEASQLLGQALLQVEVTDGPQRHFLRIRGQQTFGEIQIATGEAVL